MTPKLILFDLDGTLLDEEKQLSPENREALLLANQNGAEIVIATGRFYGGLPQAIKDLSFVRYFILMNGAKVYDRQEDRVLYRAEIPMEIAQQVFSFLGGVDCSVDCYQNDHGWMDEKYFEKIEYYLKNPHARELTIRTRTIVQNFPKVVAQNGDSVQKIQSYFPDLSLRPKVKEQLHQKFPMLVQSISMPANLELNWETATKGHALKALAQHLGIPMAETAAFGDGTNDLTMVQFAGIGVAMDNGAEELKQVADQIAPSNVEHGVAQVLNGWFC